MRAISEKYACNFKPNCIHFLDWIFSSYKNIYFLYLFKFQADSTFPQKFVFIPSDIYNPLNDVNTLTGALRKEHLNKPHDIKLATSTHTA